VARLAFLLGVEPVSLLSGAELHARSAALVFLNGSILGLHRRPKKFVRAMR
jgi:DNA-directed RNA polymerase III subunit RPC2